MASYSYSRILVVPRKACTSPLCLVDLLALPDHPVSQQVMSLVALSYTGEKVLDKAIQNRKLRSCYLRLSPDAVMTLASRLAARGN